MNHAEQNNVAEISEENIMDQWQLYKETRSTEIRNEIVLQYTGLAGEKNRFPLQGQLQ